MQWSRTQEQRVRAKRNTPVPNKVPQHCRLTVPAKMSNVFNEVAWRIGAASGFRSPIREGRNGCIVDYINIFYFWITQVKIWFQNRRSKFKKMWKNAEMPKEQNLSSRESPPCSSPSSVVWDHSPHQSINCDSAIAQNNSPAAAAFIGNYSWYPGASSASHFQSTPILQHQPTVSTATMYWVHLSTDRCLNWDTKDSA